MRPYFGRNLYFLKIFVLFSSRWCRQSHVAIHQNRWERSRAYGGSIIYQGIWQSSPFRAPPCLWHFLYFAPKARKFWGVLWPVQSFPHCGISRTRGKALPCPLMEDLILWVVYLIFLYWFLIEMECFHMFLVKKEAKTKKKTIKQWTLPPPTSGVP